MKKLDLIVVGAGPAGLMASIKAADEGLSVCIVESMPLPARKLGISGKGRGNLTNTAPLLSFLKHFNNKGRFLKAAFAQFFNNELVAFFEQEGLETVVERGGRVFVATGKATDASRCLHKSVEKRKIDLMLSTKVKSLIITDGVCLGVQLEDGRKLLAERVLLATGGLSYPRTGSTGDGIEMARLAGHKIVEPRPSLVALKPAEAFPEWLNGTTLKFVSAELRIDGKKAASEMGEMQFIDGCLGGPIIITMSRMAVEAMSLGHKTEIILDIKPALTFEQVDKRILRDIQSRPRGLLKELLTGLLPSAMQKYCLAATGFKPDLCISDLTTAQRKVLRNWLKMQTYEITGHAGWEQAIVTAGGIDCSQINPNTLESKVIKNLCFAGEIIDIDADTGGFNLQAAFSTGRLAGTAIAESLKNKQL